MIDSHELQEMRQRAEAARHAIVVVQLHGEDGVFGDLPAEDAAPLLGPAVASARDVPPLIETVGRLRPAEYVTGPEQCVEGDCDEEDPADGEWCSHVTEKVAKLGDVKRAEVLNRLVCSLRTQLGYRSDGFSRELCEEIDEAYEQMAADDDIREVVDAAELVSAEPAGTPRDGGPDHRGDR